MTEVDDNGFGSAVREARKGRGWSQEELAKRAGLSRKTVSRVEIGTSAAGPTGRSLEAALNLPPMERDSAPSALSPHLVVLGRALRDIRRRQRLTLKEAAAALSISLSQLSRLERGLAVPRALFDVGEGADVELRNNAWHVRPYSLHKELIADLATGDGTSIGPFRRA